MAISAILQLNKGFNLIISWAKVNFKNEIKASFMSYWKSIMTTIIRKVRYIFRKQQKGCTLKKLLQNEENGYKDSNISKRKTGHYLLFFDLKIISLDLLSIVNCRQTVPSKPNDINMTLYWRWLGYRNDNQNIKIIGCINGL